MRRMALERRYTGLLRLGLGKEDTCLLSATIVVRRVCFQGGGCVLVFQMH